MSDLTRKKELLDHYAARQPRRFMQFDGVCVDPADRDGVVVPDEDGHSLLGGATWELMHGADVRVLVPNDGTVTPADAARLLRKIAEWIEHRDGLGLTEPLADDFGITSEEEDRSPGR